MGALTSVFMIKPGEIVNIISKHDFEVGVMRVG
jgi:hypothetical protein